MVGLNGGKSVVYSLLSLTKSHIIVEMSELLIIRLHRGLQNRQWSKFVAVSADLQFGDDVFRTLEK